MSITPGAQQVFPSPGGTGAGGGGPAGGTGGSGSGGGGRFKLDRKTAMWAGAGVVALVALFATRGGSAEEGTGEDVTLEPTEFDTTSTDLYDLLDEMRDDPAPVRPIDITITNPDPTPNNADAIARFYRVTKEDRKGGDDLGNIAKKFKVPRAKLWGLNKTVITRANKDNQRGKVIPVGTTLAIPKK